MTEGYYTMTGVRCENCKQAAAMPPNLARSLDEVWQLAEKVHVSTGIVCGEPLLVVTYVSALVSDAFAKKIEDAYREHIDGEKKLVLPVSTGGPH